MSNSSRGNSFNRVLVDMNTQCDFLLPKGALPVANRREIVPGIRRLMNWARNQRLPVISSLEAHRPMEVPRGLPAHCVDQSNGQKKLPFTLLPKRVLLFGDNTIDVPFEVFRKYQQVIFTKRDRDFLNNPKADRLVNALDVNHLVVFGVVTEYCVKTAVLGLLTRRHRVVVVTDACGYWSSADHELALRQMDAKSAILVTAEELISGAADERIANSQRPVPVVEEEEDEILFPSFVRNSGSTLYTHDPAPTNGKHAGNGKDTAIDPAEVEAHLLRHGLGPTQLPSKSKSDPGSPGLA